MEVAVFLGFLLGAAFAAPSLPTGMEAEAVPSIPPSPMVASVPVDELSPEELGQAAYQVYNEGNVEAGVEELFGEVEVTNMFIAPDGTPVVLEFVPFIDNVAGDPVKVDQVGILESTFGINANEGESPVAVEDQTSEGAQGDQATIVEESLKQDPSSTGEIPVKVEATAAGDRTTGESTAPESEPKSVADVNTASADAPDASTSQGKPQKRTESKEKLKENIHKA